MIRWPLIRVPGYPVPQYLACPNGRGVDDPAHQPVTIPSVMVALPVKCSCGFLVTEESARRLDAY